MISTAASLPADRRTVARVAAVTVSASFLAFLDATIVNVAFPSIQASFPATGTSELSWVLNAYNVVFAALLLPFGRVGDVVGHRRVFAGGVAVFTLASALCAAAPGVDFLIAARAVQAIGAAAILPSALALLLEQYPLEARTRAVALGGMAAGVAAALGPSLGGLIVEVSSWRLVFLVNLPLGALVVWGALAWLPAVEPTQRSLPDAGGTVLLATGVALVAFGLVQGPDWGWDHWGVLASFAAALLLIAAGVRRAARHLDPAFDLRLLRAPGVAVANVATAIFAAAFFAKILCDVLFLTSVWGYSVLTAGLAMSPSPLITGLTAGTAGRLAQRFGHRPVVLAGALLYATGCAYYALAMPVEPAYLTHFLPATLLTGIGIACALPMLTSAAVHGLPAAEFGSGSGANATARQLGGVLGLAVLVALLDSATGPSALDRFHLAWGFIAASAALTALLAVRLPDDRAHAHARVHAARAETP